MHKTFVIAVVNEKGGTGKTTTSVSLSAALGELGQKVMLVDLDGQAASSRWLGVEEDNRLADALCRGGGLDPLQSTLANVWLAPASGKLDSVAHDLRPTQGGQLRKVLAEHRQFDFILIDCPPSLGNRLIGNALLAATHVLVPVETSILALDGLRILLTTLQDVRDGFGHDLVLAGVLACRYDPRTKLSRLVLAELRRALPQKVFQTVIRENVRMRECPASGESILSYAGDSHAATDYRALAAEMLEHPLKWQLAAGDQQADEEAVSNLRGSAAAAVRQANLASNTSRPAARQDDDSPADELAQDDVQAVEPQESQQEQAVDGLAQTPAEAVAPAPADEPPPVQQPDVCEAPAVEPESMHAPQAQETQPPVNHPQPQLPAGNPWQRLSALTPCVVPPACKDPTPPADVQTPAAPADTVEAAVAETAPSPAQAGLTLATLEEEYSPDHLGKLDLGPGAGESALACAPVSDWLARLNQAQDRLAHGQADVAEAVEAPDLDADGLPTQDSDEAAPLPLAQELTVEINMPAVAEEPRPAQAPRADADAAAEQTADQQANLDWILAVTSGTNDGQTAEITETTAPIADETPASHDLPAALDMHSPLEKPPQQADEHVQADAATSQQADGTSGAAEVQAVVAEQAAEPQESVPADAGQAQQTQQGKAPTGDHPALRKLIQQMAAEGKLPDPRQDRPGQAARVGTWRRLFRKQTT